MKNIIVDAILSGATLLPGIGPVVKSGKDALADGKITVDEIEDFVDKAATAAEDYTPDKVDAELEQFKKALHECIVLEKMLTAPGTSA